MSAAHSPASAPPPGTYWVEPERFLAGAYPGHVDPVYALARIDALLALGIDTFIDLSWPGELPAYEGLLPLAHPVTGVADIGYSRRAIRDHGLPAEPAQMQEILAELERSAGRGASRSACTAAPASAGRASSWAGHLARCLGSGAAGLEELDRLWRQSGRDRDWPATAGRRTPSCITAAGGGSMHRRARPGRTTRRRPTRPIASRTGIADFSMGLR